MQNKNMTNTGSFALTDMIQYPLLPMEEIHNILCFILQGIL